MIAELRSELSAVDEAIAVLQRRLSGREKIDPGTATALDEGGWGRECGVAVRREARTSRKKSNHSRSSYSHVLFQSGKVKSRLTIHIEGGAETSNHLSGAIFEGEEATSSGMPTLAYNLQNTVAKTKPKRKVAFPPQRRPLQSFGE